MLAYTFSQGEIKEGIELMTVPNPCTPYLQDIVRLGGKLDIPIRKSTGYISIRKVDGKEVLFNAEVGDSERLNKVCAEALQCFPRAEDFRAFPYLRGLSDSSFQFGRIVRVVVTPEWSLDTSGELLVKALQVYGQYGQTSNHPLCIARVGSSTNGDYLFVFREMDKLCFRIPDDDPDCVYVLMAAPAPVKPYAFSFYRGRYRGLGKRTT